jgi:pimeloyl-ACP methyl ester carboxylesterase
MSLRKEVTEDAKFIYELLLKDASREFTFEGVAGPLVAINGIGGGWSEGGLRSFMQENGVRGKLIYKNLLLQPLKSQIPLIAEEIARYENAIVVGFSAGGLMMLNAVDKYNLWSQIKKVITIATPLDGINIKPLDFLNESLKDVQKGSDFLREIEAISPPNDKVVSIFAKEDKFIPHPERIHISWNKIITEARSHGDIQNNRQWYTSILSAEISS